MKTKQPFMQAKIGPYVDNATQYNKPLLQRFVLVDKTTEREVVDCRVYGTSNGQTLRCAIWIDVKNSKVPAKYKASYDAGYKVYTIGGRGFASGAGYHKLSQVVQGALHDAGISLYGSPYNRESSYEKGRSVAIGGCGDQSITAALLATAHAAGWNNVILVD